MRGVPGIATGPIVKQRIREEPNSKHPRGHGDKEQQNSFIGVHHHKECQDRAETRTGPKALQVLASVGLIVSRNLEKRASQCPNNIQLK